VTAWDLIHPARGLPPAPVPNNYAVYFNERFGFAVAYPRYLIASPESDQRDGRAFMSPDNSVIVFASARNLAEGEKLADYYIAYLNGLREHILDVFKGENFFQVLSQKPDGSTITFVKYWFGPSCMNILSVDYPASQHDECGPMMADVARSFRPGPLDRAW
jgi:hypothetical protein